MRTSIFGGVLVVAVLSLAVPALAQDRGHQAGGGGDNGGARNSGGGASTGTAVSRGDGGFVGGGGASSSGSTGSTAAGSGGYVGQTFPGGGSSNGSPVPTPMGGTTLSGARSRTGGAVAARGMMRNEFAADPVDHAIPAGSRPNYGHPTLGNAIERSKPQVGTGGASTNDLYPYVYYGYNGNNYFDYLYGYGSAYSYGLMPYYLLNATSRNWGPLYGPLFSSDALYGYGAFGLGSFYYDPLWFGGAGYGLDFMGGGGGSSSPSGPPKGGLKLKVTPEDAEVVVDGVRRGKVNQFNSAFERLNLPVGPHHVELSAQGYQPLSFDVTIEPRDTIAYRGTMQALQPVK